MRIAADSSAMIAAGLAARIRYAMSRPVH